MGNEPEVPQFYLECETQNRPYRKPDLFPSCHFHLHHQSGYTSTQTRRPVTLRSRLTDGGSPCTDSPGHWVVERWDLHLTTLSSPPRGSLLRYRLLLQTSQIGSRSINKGSVYRVTSSYLSGLHLGIFISVDYKRFSCFRYFTCFLSQKLFTASYKCTFLFSYICV